MRRLAAFAVAGMLGGSVWSGGAAANDEVYVMSDGRSVGMGGTGVARNETAMSPIQNPANLGRIGTFVGTATASILAASTEEPSSPGFPGSVESDLSPAPLGNLGAAYRLHERVVLGLAAFVASGQGGVYPDYVPGHDVDITVFTAEVQVPVAVTLADGLHLSVAYRLSVLSGAFEVPFPSPQGDGTILDSKTEASSTNFAGVAAGIVYDATPDLSFGVAYRNQIAFDLEGDTTISAGGMTIDESDLDDELKRPHVFRLGVAVDLLDDALQLALDGSYWLFSQAIEADPAAGKTEDAEDSIGINLGAEYWVSPTLPLRIGGYYLKSATPPESAFIDSPIPGYTLGGTAGFGWRFESFDVDAAFAYARLAETEVTTGNFQGTRSGQSVQGTVSFNYRM